MSPGALKVGQALQDARALGVDRLDAQLLLAETLACSRTWLLAHDEAELSAEQSARLRSRLERRAAGEPLAYLLGEKEFHGLLLQVNASVLVPRPETELLVDWALELLAGSAAHSSVVDLGTGSGAVALAVKHAFPAALVLATDVSASALETASANATRLALQIEFAEGSWWQAVAQRRFQLALSNPPYIAAGDPHLAALSHEPTLALTPGGDGLSALRSLVGGAQAHLEPGGWLLVEHGFDQAAAVQALLHQHGLVEIQTRRDLAGQPRCSGGHTQ
jgi:release factor glutamine methyltransferase